MARGVLTTEVLSRYNGGQFEVSNRHEGYTYRGEIEEAKVNGAGDGDIVLKLKWMAKLSEDGEWEKDDELTYSASLKIYSWGEVGEGRLHISSPITHESGTFFPPGGSRLDPTKVRGL